MMMETKMLDRETAYALCKALNYLLEHQNDFPLETTEQLCKWAWRQEEFWPPVTEEQPEPL